jgi:hypothetical protein
MKMFGVTRLGDEGTSSAPGTQKGRFEAFNGGFQFSWARWPSKRKAINRQEWSPILIVLKNKVNKMPRERPSEDKGNRKSNLQNHAIAQS